MSSLFMVQESMGDVKLLLFCVCVCHIPRELLVRVTGHSMGSKLANQSVSKWKTTCNLDNFCQHVLKISSVVSTFFKWKLTGESCFQLIL